MSGVANPRSGFTRRSFLKATGATAALGLAGAAGMTSASSWLAPATGHAEPEDKTCIMCHNFHCLSSCGLKCHVRDGRLALIEPQEFEDGTRGRICLRGIAEVQHVYSTDRLQTPLKRVGERGEGKFEPITWDEAIETIANAIKDSWDKYGTDSFFYRKSTEASVAHNYEFLSSLLHADTGGRWGLDRGQANGANPSGLTYSGLAANSITEWKDAATVVHLGSNLLESAMTWTYAFFDAKEAGTRMITIDPRFSPTASKSDQWLPVKPGTDAALILGTIQCILENQWYDEEHMSAHTSLPYLVDTATGAVMGKTVKVTDELTGEPADKFIPLVWDAATNKARYIDEEGVTGALEGTHKVDGKKVTTQFELLKEQMAAYTLDWASGVTGIDANTIYDFADRYANAGPAIISIGFGGPDKYTNADVLGHAGAILVALTGNSGKPGTGYGFYGLGGGAPAPEALKYWALPEEFVPGESPVAMYDMPFKENNIHCALTFGDAFTLEAGNANAMIEWVKGLDFFAICDIYHSSAVDYADIVLPACSKFEGTEETNDVRVGYNAPYVYLNQTCIEPLFESKGDIEVERLIAAQFGLDQHLPQSYEELARYMLSEPAGNMEGMTFDALKEKGAMRISNGSDVVTAEVAFPNQTYPTATGRIELYYENLLAAGQAFPQYETPSEAYADNPKTADYPLVFMQGKSRFRIHAFYSASSWFHEYLEPVVNINPRDAEARGIATGDDVKVFNDRGYFVARALVNDAMQPGVLFMAETTYNHYYKEGFLQNVTNDFKQERCYDMVFGPQIPYNDTIVELQKA